MSRWNLAWLLGICTLTLVGLSLSYSAPQFTGNLQQKYENINLIIDVMSKVEKKYVKPLDAKKMRELAEKMIDGGLRSLDPHSGFITQEDFKRFERYNKGKFGGVGIRIVQDPQLNDAIVVDSPMVGTPAYKAGILAGDIIKKVDGKSTDNKSINEVADWIQGKPNTNVVLTVRHKGETETVDITVTRAIIRVDSVMGDVPVNDEKKKWEYVIDKKNQVAYVRITGFTETTVKELAEVVRRLQMEGMKALILDLRDNPGGLLRAAVDVSDLFLPAGSTIVSTRGRNQREEVYRSRNAPIVRVPIAILLNRYSASASEIVAAALKDHIENAIVVGERSYGKGSVQNVIRMEEGRTALKLTTASYWRPNGKNIHRFRDAKETDDWGVKPSKGYEVEQSLEDLINYWKHRRERDVFRKKGAKKKEGKEYKDQVLEKALKYLRGQVKNGEKSARVRPAPFRGPLQQAVPVPAGTMARYPMVPPPPVVTRKAPV